MLYTIAHHVLFRMPPEWAHEAGTFAMDWAATLGLTGLLGRKPPPCPVEAMGLSFPNPLGMAAGFDKNGTHAAALAALGFGHIETGTVTPRPQPGNPQPRLFRIPEERALINRMGFNNCGVEQFLRNLEGLDTDAILGISIGKNFDTPIENAVEDYLYCLERVYGHADYVAVNVSSPNTKNLRDLQEAGALDRMLGTLAEARERLATEHGVRVPMAAKVAPDLDDDAIAGIAKAIEGNGFDAVIATNTTISRQGVTKYPHGREQGGLSGAPLRKRSTEVIRALRACLAPTTTVIGAGGIFGGKDAVEKLEAGANLLQVYTGFIYEGPPLIREVVKACAGHFASESQE
jgi:dihydroorotate dehydrogenase